MPTVYVRNPETGEFELVCTGGEATDTTLSQVGKPADAAAVGDKFTEQCVLINNTLSEAKSYTDTEIASLVNSAPETLDTIGELAVAFEENKDMVTTLDAAITTKANTADVESALENYVLLSQRGVVNGVAPLNANKKIDSQYLPVYTEANIVANDSIADLAAKQTWSSEQTYNYEDYGLVLEDTIAGVAAGFKAPRGHFNQLFVDDIVFTRGTTGQTAGLMADEIGFYVWSGVESKAAVRDSAGNITTEGYNNLLGYEKVAAITKDGGLILKSSTSGSSKFFKITVNDSGALSATEVTT